MIDEEELREILGAPLDCNKKPQDIFKQLAAFWAHFAIYKRKCDGSGKTIYSTYDDNCPYPVFERQYWIENANPQQAIFDFDKPFFEQLYKVFKNSPIPHNQIQDNQNCDYTDDAWHCKNCYLSHSILKSEDCQYCFRGVYLKDCQFAIFSNSSELCIDIINCDNLYKVNFAINSRKCENSSFLYDCRGIKDCFMCWNLRNKKYCILNKQLTREEYEKEIKKYDLSSVRKYIEIKNQYIHIIMNNAFFKALEMEQCEDSDGNYMRNCKNVKNGFFIDNIEDSINILRGYDAKMSLNCVSPSFNCQKLYYCSVVQENGYEDKFCSNLVNCQYMEYCQHCLNCSNCFGCQGLVNERFCILNKRYKEDEYNIIVEKIKIKMAKDGILGEFFPPYFAPNNYEDSLASCYWTLTDKDIQDGYRVKKEDMTREDNFLDLDNLPDSYNDIDDSIYNQIFWDDQAKKPFRINTRDIEFARKTNTALLYCYYLRRLRDNFSWLYFDGGTRETVCSITGKRIETTLPIKFDNKILSEEAYLEEIV